MVYHGTLNLSLMWPVREVLHEALKSFLDSTELLQDRLVGQENSNHQSLQSQLALGLPSLAYF